MKNLTEKQLEWFYEISGKYIDAGYSQKEADRMALLRVEFDGACNE